MPADYKTAGPVTLTEAQIKELHDKLRTLRHDLNGRLANIIAAAELIRMRPEQMRAERLQMVKDESFKAKDLLAQYSQDFETAFGLSRA